MLCSNCERHAHLFACYLPTTCRACDAPTPHDDKLCDRCSLAVQQCKHCCSRRIHREEHQKVKANRSWSLAPQSSLAAAAKSVVAMNKVTRLFRDVKYPLNQQTAVQNDSGAAAENSRGDALEPTGEHRTSKLRMIRVIFDSFSSLCDYDNSRRMKRTHFMYFLRESSLLEQDSIKRKRQFDIFFTAAANHHNRRASSCSGTYLHFDAFVQVIGSMAVYLFQRRNSLKSKFQMALKLLCNQLEPLAEAKLAIHKKLPLNKSQYAPLFNSDLIRQTIALNDSLLRAQFSRFCRAPFSYTNTMNNDRLSWRGFLEFCKKIRLVPEMMSKNEATNLFFCIVQCTEKHSDANLPFATYEEFLQLIFYAAISSFQRIYFPATPHATNQRLIIFLARVGDNLGETTKTPILPTATRDELKNKWILERASTWGDRGEAILRQLYRVLLRIDALSNGYELSCNSCRMLCRRAATSKTLETHALIDTMIAQLVNSDKEGSPYFSFEEFSMAVSDFSHRVWDKEQGKHEQSILTRMESIMSQLIEESNQRKQKYSLLSHQDVVHKLLSNQTYQNGLLKLYNDFVTQDIHRSPYMHLDGFTALCRQHNVIPGALTLRQVNSIYHDVVGGDQGAATHATNCTTTPLSCPGLDFNKFLIAICRLAAQAYLSNDFDSVVKFLYYVENHRGDAIFRRSSRDTSIHERIKDPMQECAQLKSILHAL